MQRTKSGSALLLAVKCNDIDNRRSITIFARIHAICAHLPMGVDGCRWVSACVSGRLSRIKIDVGATVSSRNVAHCADTSERARKTRASERAKEREIEEESVGAVVAERNANCVRPLQRTCFEGRRNVTQR